MVILAQGAPKTDLAAAAFAALPPEVDVLPGENQAARAALEQADVVIDCVFGFSFRGELSGLPAQLLGYAGVLPCLKLSADLPSGVECDTGRVSPGAFRADVTVTFTGKKPANVLLPRQGILRGNGGAASGGARRPGRGSRNQDLRNGKELPPGSVVLPGPAGQQRGHGQAAAGVRQLGHGRGLRHGGKAALRCGVGLLQIAVEERLYPLVAQAVPQAIYLVLDWENRREESESLLLDALSKCTACVTGCGLGERSELVCPLVFSHCQRPLVADADAINFLSRHPGFFRKSVEIPLVLTPHPGEMARLCDDSIPEIQSDRLGAAQQKARKTGAVVVLKGAATVIAAPDGRCAVNPTGNPGMAKGGSGDVLAGMAGAFLAQGLSAFETAVLAAYLHGYAGDLCAQAFTQRAMLPTDLPEMLPQVFRRLLGA